MQSLRVLQASLICLLCLGGCTTLPQESPLQAEQLRQLPRVTELEDVPFYPQTDYECGPAALATVLQAQGVDVSPEALSPQVYLPRRRGSLQIEMIAAARQYKIFPYVLERSFSALLMEVAAGNPVLVLKNLGFGRLPRWHYAVVVGYDLDKEVLILRSGTVKRRQVSFAVFKRTWQRSDYWALLVLAVGEIPVTATVDAYLEVAHAFEETGLTEQAAVSYRAATRRWPGESKAWLMSGNLAFTEQRTDEATADFLQATGLAPDDTRGWNNLAYALRDQGCVEQAKAALQCALGMAPGDHNLLDSLKDMEQSIDVQRHEQCPKISCTNAR